MEIVVLCNLQLLQLKVLSYWNLNEGIENVYHWEMLLKVLSYWNLNVPNTLENFCSVVS